MAPSASMGFFFSCSPCNQTLLGNPPTKWSFQWVFTKELSASHVGPKNKGLKTRVLGLFVAPLEGPSSEHHPGEIMELGGPCDLSTPWGTTLWATSHVQ